MIMNIPRNLPQLFLLAAALLSFPAVMRAQFTFVTNGGAITITGYNGSPVGLDVPGSTNGFAVVGIGDSAFKNMTTLTGVTLPDSVTSVGNSAFQACSGLTNVTLGGGLLSIGNNAFQYDFKLADVSIPDGVTSIGSMAFFNCSGMTNISIGSGVTNIGAMAFIACYGLEAINVNPANSAYGSLAGVLFDKNQTTLLQYPGGKPGNYTLPNSATNIGDSAFASCSQLTSVATGDFVVNIGTSAFAGSDSLTNILLGANVTGIGGGAFDSDFHLTAITVASNNPAYGSEAGVLFNKSRTTLLQYPGGKLGDYTPPASVVSIGDNAFAGCINLTNVSIGDNVTNIGGGVFYECVNLTNVTIGAGLASIGYDGFDQCYGLLAINVAPENQAFSSVAGLLYDKDQTRLIRCPGGIAGSCTIPGSVTSIENYAFLNDYQVDAVYFEGNAPSSGSLAFDDSLTVYYLPGTSGWTSSFGGMPAVLWNPQAQVSGAGANPFGFFITGGSNLTLVIEACTNFANPVWQPVATNTLPGGSAYFADPQWTNYPCRFYRFRSQ